jgi:hypothetical protein
MSFQSLGFTHTLPAGADLSSAYRRFVMVNASSQLVLPAAGGQAIGVTLDKATLGAACPFQQLGIAQVELGGTVAAGGKVTTDVNGKAVAAATGNVVLGTCIVGGASGAIGAILLTPNVNSVAP